MIWIIFKIRYAQSLASKVLLLVHMLEPHEYFLFDIHIGFFTIFLMESEKLKLKFIDVAVIDKLSIFIMYGELFGNKLSVF